MGLRGKKGEMERRKGGKEGEREEGKEGGRGRERGREGMEEKVLCKGRHSHNSRPFIQLCVHL